MNHPSLNSEDLADVADAIRSADAAELAPRFRRLSDRDIEEKSPGEIVTAADRACEAVLSLSLTRIADVPIVGEEAAASDPRVLDALDPEATYWLVDPLDGTVNFAAGSADYAVMVAYIHRGATAASWIWIPDRNQMFIAEQGAGATCNEVPLATPETLSIDGGLAGVIKERFLPADVARSVTARAPQLGTVHPGVLCAGIEYPDLALGRTNYVLYWRTLPWDHAPGVLLAAEAGFVSIRPDGSAYEPHSTASGLLVAPAAIAAELRERLLGQNR